MGPHPYAHPCACRPGAIRFKWDGGSWEGVAEMERAPFTIELCGNKAGYEVSPAAEHALDLSEAARTLEAAGFTVLSNAGILLVAQLGLVEVSVFESARLLLKTKDEAVATEATEITYRALGVIA